MEVKMYIQQNFEAQCVSSHQTRRLQMETGFSRRDKGIQSAACTELRWESMCFSIQALEREAVLVGYRMSCVTNTI